MGYTSITDIAAANSAIADLYGQTDALMRRLGGLTVSSMGGLPLSGGTMTGTITTPNNAVGIVVGDDARLADRNTTHTMFLESNTSADRGYLNFSSTAGNALGCVNGQALTWRGTPLATTTLANGYYGIDTPNGDWLRISNGNGLIPYSSGGVGALGTSGWRWSSIYGVNMDASGKVTFGTMGSANSQGVDFDQYGNIKARADAGAGNSWNITDYGGLVRLIVPTGPNRGPVTVDGYAVWHTGNFNPAGKLDTSASCNRNWYWSGQGGQPPWLWGGSDGTNMYVYNPSNFSVNYANTAGTANSSSFGGTPTNVSGQDMLATRATGLYMGSSMANAPDANWWYFINMYHNDTWQMVMCFPLNIVSSPKWRRKNAGTWGAWVSLTSSI